MSDSIGSAAGVVWNYLDETGPSSITKMAKDTSLDTKVLQRAIGWLAKEDKVSFEVKGRTEVVTLKYH